MSSFVDLASRMIAEKQVPALDMIKLAEQYLAIMSSNGIQSQEEYAAVEAFIRSARERAPATMEHDLEAIRRRIDALEQQEAKLTPLIADMFHAACEVTNDAESILIHKVGKSPQTTSEVSTAAIDALANSINALYGADSAFDRILDEHGKNKK